MTVFRGDRALSECGNDVRRPLSSCGEDITGRVPGLAIQPGNPGCIAAITYFSLSALTTAGFSDIVPIHPFARCLANMEAIIGQLYPATLLARIDAAARIRLARVTVRREQQD